MAAAGSVLLLLGGIWASLLWEGKAAFGAFGWGFLVSPEWDPVAEKYGALVPVVGTLVTSVLALLIAVPLSFLVAFFLVELAPAWLRHLLGSAVELLAGIPSVVFGIWGLFVFAPLFARAEPWISTHLGRLPVAGALFRGPPIGVGMLTAGIVLGVMVIPYVCSIMREVFLVVPTVLKESAYALGATSWEVFWKVVVPYTRTGLIGGILLGLGRALGETMAVTFVIGNAHELSASLLAPGTSIAAVLANEFSEATTDLYRSSLLALGFILFGITLVVLAAGRLLLHRIQRSLGTTP
jgi:phosphate transport system permease protein